MNFSPIIIIRATQKKDTTPEGIVSWLGKTKDATDLSSEKDS